MKNRVLSCVVIMLVGGLAAGCTSEPEYQGGPTTITVMTFNVLCSLCNPDEYDPWDERLDYFADIFERHHPDLIGLQELTFVQEVEQMVELNPEYEAICFHDDDGPLFDDYPDATILYRRDLFDVLDQGTYWLSPTPETPWTVGWAPQNIWRLVTWAHLRHRVTGSTFYFATTHFDNNSPNQEMSAPVVLQYTEPWAQDIPVLVVGDFNSQPDSEAYQILTQGVDGAGFHLTNSFDFAETWRVEYNQDPAPEYDPDQRIDHIFTAGQPAWSCSDWVVDLYRYGESDRYPSDHFAIAATLTFE